MTILLCLERIGDFLAVFLTIIGFLQNYLKNLPIIKYIYPENWYKYVNIYFFTEIKLDNSDLDCEEISIRGSPIDNNSKFTYQIPFKLCIPKIVGKLNKIDELEITFITSEENELHIMEHPYTDLGKTIKIKKNALQTGTQGRYYIKVTRDYDGVSIPINIESRINKNTKKRSWIVKSNIIINGLEVDSLKLRTQ